MPAIVRSMLPLGLLLGAALPPPAGAPAAVRAWGRWAPGAPPEQHGLEVITFLYCHFRPGDGGEAEDGSSIYPFATSWEDTGEAFRYGLRATDLPSCHEVFDIVASLPQGKFSNEKAQRLLGWVPKHNFERLYRRPGS